jgi:hypothetical protein
MKDIYTLLQILFLYIYSYLVYYYYYIYFRLERLFEHLYYMAIYYPYDAAAYFFFGLFLCVLCRKQLKVVFGWFISFIWAIVRPVLSLLWVIVRSVLLLLGVIVRAVLLFLWEIVLAIHEFWMKLVRTYYVYIKTYSIREKVGLALQLIGAYLFFDFLRWWFQEWLKPYEYLNLDFIHYFSLFLGVMFLLYLINRDKL